MSAHKPKALLEAPYNRGDFWLGKRPGFENWYVFRYNDESKTNDYWSTGSSDLVQACLKLDERYLAATDQSHAFCPTCGQKVADGGTYPLLQAIRDYKIEVGRLRDSYDSIKARLGHVIRYVSEELDDEMLSCAKASVETFVEGLRAWLKPQPVEWRNKAGEVTASSPRSDASVEESVHQLKAVLNHAVFKERSDAKPTFKSKSRKTVSRQVRTRADVEMLAKMLDYACNSERHMGLRRFLISSICTAARPDAIYDMNIIEERQQWLEQEGLFDLNPFGREQTKKYRPVLPILPPLAKLIENTKETSPEGWLVHYRGEQVNNIRSAWRTMRDDLGIKKSRETGSYLIRRSMSTILRQSGARAWDVEGLLGHRIAGTTETYAYDTIFVTARTEIESIIANIEDTLGKPVFDITWQTLGNSSEEEIKKAA